MTASHVAGGAALATLTLAAAALMASPQAAAGPGPTFSLATEEAGLDFVHEHGGTGERYMVETIGSGVSLADLDADGRLDVYLVQSGPTPEYEASPGGGDGAAGTAPLVNRLYRNRGELRFAAVPHSGLEDAGYGMGSAVADHDGDGFPDVYVTNFGPDALYRNNGDGTFSDVTAAAGVSDELWSTSAAWADVDLDGDLDLYVANYVDFGWDNHKFCGNPRRNLRAYCHPDVYNGLPDRLYRNRGDGTFEEAGEAAGVVNVADGKGLGVVVGDHDADGDPDIYVANDSTRNFLYTNRGDGTFFDDALLAGVGYSEDGKPEAGMGTDWADYDGDGRLDVVVTNLDLETNTLYRNLGGATFTDVTFATGLGEPSLLYVGFGTNWFDYDHDADVDLLVANGHIIDNIESFKDNVTYAQANHLYRNDGGSFREIHASAGPGFAPVKVSRGTAVGDLDGDGDLDAVITNNDQPVDLLRNDGGEAAGNWIALRLVGRRSPRTPAGARATVVPVESRDDHAAAPSGGNMRSEPEAAPALDAPIVLEVKLGSSYLSSSDPTLHTGLGAATTANVSIRWPGGAVEELGMLVANRTHLVIQGRGVVAGR